MKLVSSPALQYIENGLPARAIAAFKLRISKVTEKHALECLGV